MSQKDSLRNQCGCVSGRVGISGSAEKVRLGTRKAEAPEAAPVSDGKKTGTTLGLVATGIGILAAAASSMRR